MPAQTKSLDGLRPKALQNKIMGIRKRCGLSFYQTHHNAFVDIPCPACGAQGEPMFTKFGFSHKKCPSCDTIYCSPRPTEKLLEVYYSTSEAALCWTNFLSQTDTKRKAIQYGPRVEHILKFIKNDSSFHPIRAVDLGAGSGAFALCLRNTNYFPSVVAVDISEECCQTCKKLGLETLHGSVQDIPHSPVSLITMNDVIEHLYDPKKILKKCHAALDKGGYLAIACLNGKGFDIQIMESDAVNVTPPEHLNYFNPRSMKRLLQSTGFSIIDISTPGILDVQIVARAYEDEIIDLKDNHWLRSLLEQKNDAVLNGLQKFLIDTMWSSHMVCLARKN